MNCARDKQQYYKMPKQLLYRFCAVAVFCVKQLHGNCANWHIRRWILWRLKQNNNAKLDIVRMDYI